MGIKYPSDWKLEDKYDFDLVDFENSSAIQKINYTPTH